MREGNGRWAPATAAQKRKIAQLCVALGIREPIEEVQMGIGSAGELIRRMSLEVKDGRRRAS